LWIGAIISFLAVVIKGVVAAPLWAFAHLDTDGQGMGQRTQVGYIFLMEALLRPILMVIGFVAAVIMIDVMGKVLFVTFPLAVSDAGTATGVIGGLIGTVVSVAAFCTISIMIVNISVSLIHAIPDHAMRYFGGMDHAGGIGSNASGEFTNASAAVTGAVGMGGKGVMGMAKQRAQGMQDAASRAASGAANKAREDKADARHDAMVGAISAAFKNPGRSGGGKAG